MEECYFYSLLKVTLQHSSMGVFHVFEIVQMVPNRGKHDIVNSGIQTNDKQGNEKFMHF